MAVGNIAISEAQASFTKGHSRHDLVELCVGYALILVVIWTPRPWQRLSYVVAATFLVVVLWNTRSGWKNMGFQMATFLRSSWLIGVALVAAAMTATVAHELHTLNMPSGPLMFVGRYAGYAMGACIQQILLQTFLLPRLLRLTSSPGSAALVAAGMFSLAHLPNPILTVITFFWGLAACLFFLRYRNLYTLAIAHTILGITVAMIIPGPVIHNMRVGLGYLTYGAHRAHQRSH